MLHRQLAVTSTPAAHGFSATATATDPALRGTIATATNAYLGRLTFEAKTTGSGLFDWGFGHSSSIFALSDTVDIQDQISTPGGGLVTVVPEPSTGLLVALGLGGLAAARRRA